MIIRDISLKQVLLSGYRLPNQKKREGGLRGVESLFQIVSFAETYEVLDIFASIVGKIAD